MAVALNDLGGDWRGGEPEAFADALLHFRAKVRSIADGTRNFADGHLRSSIAKARDIALVLRKPIGDFQTKSDGLGVDAVSAANLWRIAEFVGAQIEDFSKHHQTALTWFGAFTNLQGLCRVPYL